MKLISMTDYVLEQHEKEVTVNYGFKDKLINTVNYAKFLKQPLTPGMFVPCDEDGNILDHPNIARGSGGTGIYNALMNQYQEAQERVLFEGLEHVFLNMSSMGDVLIKDDILTGYVEDLMKYDLTLTPNAIKIFNI
jgi:hypothetical protein